MHTQRPQGRMVTIESVGPRVHSVRTATTVYPGLGVICTRCVTPVCEIQISTYIMQNVRTAGCGSKIPDKRSS